MLKNVFYVLGHGLFGFSVYMGLQLLLSSFSLTGSTTSLSEAFNQSLPVSLFGCGLFATVGILKLVHNYQKQKEARSKVTLS